MKRAAWVLCIGAATIGCQKKAADPMAGGAQPGVMDPAPYQPAPQPVTGDPVAPMPSPASAPPSAPSGGTYTVKKGETIYAIARAKYGSDRDAKRIIAANPGINPNALKVGQVINLP